MQEQIYAKVRAFAEKTGCSTSAAQWLPEYPAEEIP